MKKVKILTIILMIILLTMVSFFGVYVQTQNRMENKLKDYSYSMELKGSRVVTFEVNKENKTIIKDAEGNEVENSENLTDDEITQSGYVKEEVAYNSAEVLNTENYQKSKKILEKRLEKLGVENYIIRLNEQTGDIILELEENEDTDYIISNIGTTGKFEIVYSATNEVLMNNEDIKLSNVMYGQDSTTGGTSVYLNIEFTKDGAKKLEDISNTYVPAEETNEESTTETEENTTDETTTEEEEATDKEITLKIDDEEIMTTSFDEPIKTGKLQLSIGNASTDEETLQSSISQASSMATVLDSGNMPIQYEVVGNQYILSDITENDLQTVKYALMGIVAIGLVVFVMRYKINGLLGAISYIGLASLFTLVLRYTNVVISIEGICGIAIVLILNYIFMNKLLGKLRKEKMKVALKETYKEFFIKIIPICIMVIAFCFINWISISSFGMVMFWGITIIAIYHIIVTNYLIADK